jgi:hypothetical protein
MPLSHPDPAKAAEFLLARGSLPVLYWFKKDVLAVPVEREGKNLEKYVGRIRVLESQAGDGSWIGPSSRFRRGEDKTDRLIETLKNLFRLHDFGCTNEEPVVRKAISFLFACQTREGDFRAASINEYTPGFHALTLEIFCRYGLDADPRVQKGFRWILHHRQKDKGWAIPCRTLSPREAEKRVRAESAGKVGPLQSNISKPSSHFITGLALRALAESPTWRTSPEFRAVADLLVRRFFQDDRYEDRRDASHWEELSYPFWSTNILSVLDALATAGATGKKPQVQAALDWLIGRQGPSGCWEVRSRKAVFEDHLWVTYAVLRVLKRFGLVSF